MTSNHIWQSARNILDSTKNLNLLYRTFDDIALNDDDLEIEHDSCEYKGDDWISPVWCKFYKVSRRLKTRLTHTGWVTIAIQLTSDNSERGDPKPWEHGRKAKVIVGFYPDKNHYWEFDTTTPDATGRANNTELDDYSWYCGVDESWFFAIDLDALTETADVEKKITTPLHAMIRGEAADKVLRNVKGLCRPPRC